jgi:hypothetical protein
VEVFTEYMENVNYNHPKIRHSYKSILKNEIAQHLMNHSSNFSKMYENINKIYGKLHLLSNASYVLMRINICENQHLHPRIQFVLSFF